MDIESRLQILISNLRSSRKTTTISVIAAALISVLIFLGGSTFFLFTYFEKLHDQYYGTILRDVSSFQRLLIGGDTYRDDMEDLARTIQTHQGVIHVWFTDRYGKLIYHTDDMVLREYRARRLPSEYYESIEQSWEFEGGYPVMHRVLLKNRLNLRISQPLYIMSRENYDFIIGLDVRRFLFIPYRVYRMVLFAAAFVILSFLLLFLPVFFLIQRRLREAESQARMVRLQGVQVPPPGLAGSEPVSEQPIMAASQPHADAAPPPLQPVEATEEEAPAGEPSPEPPAAKVISEEVQQDKIFITFLKQKMTTFSDHDVEADFLQAHNYSLHSKGAEGCYVLYQGLNGKHLMACFSAPADKAPEIYNIIVEIAEMIRGSLKTESTAVKLMKSYNSYSRKAKKNFEVSLLLIDEEKKNVEYACTGSGTAYYLKNGEEEVKELLLENPKLGSIPAKEFGQQLSSADIKLTKNDLFLLPAQNFASVNIGETALNELLLDGLVSHRKLAASEIGGSILNKFESLDLTVKNILPQSGYIVLKFL